MAAVDLATAPLAPQTASPTPQRAAAAPSQNQPPGSAAKSAPLAPAEPLQEPAPETRAAMADVQHGGAPPASAAPSQPNRARTHMALQRYMWAFGFLEPLEIRDGKTMLHYLARQSEVAAEGDRVLAAWFELLRVYCVRRPALPVGWLELAIMVDAPRLLVGWTALDMLANSYSDVAPRMAQQLLEAGAEVSPRSRARSTQPLHQARMNSNDELVDILLAAKADPHARTQLGFSCADLAPTLTLQELCRNLGVEATRATDAAGRWRNCWHCA